jgi:hypothetical protein
MNRHERRRIERLMREATGGTIEILDRGGLALLAASAPSVARCWGTWGERRHFCVCCRRPVGGPDIFAFVTVPEVGFLRGVCRECTARHRTDGGAVRDFVPVGVIDVAGLEAEVLGAMARAFAFRGPVRRVEAANLHLDKGGRA